MDSSTIYLLAKAVQHGRGDTWNHVAVTLCAACSWVGNNMGWPALFSGSVVSASEPEGGQKPTAVPLVARPDWAIGAAVTATSSPKATPPCDIRNYFPIRARRRRPIQLILSIRPW